MHKLKSTTEKPLYLFSGLDSVPCGVEKTGISRIIFEGRETES